MTNSERAEALHKARMEYQHEDSPASVMPSNRERAEQVVSNIDAVFVDLLFDRHVLANMIAAAIDAAEKRGREAERARCLNICEAYSQSVSAIHIAQAIREGKE